MAFSKLKKIFWEAINHLFMRDYFRSILKNLYVYAGVNQLEKMDDDAIRMLLNALENVSKMYSYIPEEKQKEIIDKCLLTDKEYRNINARLIAKWLEENGKHYHQQECHKGRITEEEYMPLEGEARDKAIQEYLNAISKAETNFTSAIIKGSGQQMKEQLESAGIVHNPIPPEESALNEYCKPKEE